MTNLNTDISLMIAKHLPAEVSSNLQAVLKEAEENKIKVVGFSDKIKQLEYELNRLRAREMQAEAIIDREKMLAIKERKYEIDNAILEVEKRNSQEKVSLVQGLVKSVFENRQITRVTMNTTDVPVPMGWSTMVSNTTSTEVLDDK